VRFANPMKMGRKAHKKHWRHVPRVYRPKFQTFWDLYFRELNNIKTGWTRGQS
jgi:hypothetical protein